VGINSYAPDPQAALGGIKASGFGREEGLAEYQYDKSISPTPDRATELRVTDAGATDVERLRRIEDTEAIRAQWHRYMLLYDQGGAHAELEKLFTEEAGLGRGGLLDGRLTASGLGRRSRLLRAPGDHLRDPARR
jgi:hypothetical protein